MHSINLNYLSLVKTTSLGIYSKRGFSCTFYGKIKRIRLHLKPCVFVKCNSSGDNTIVQDWWQSGAHNRERHYTSLKLIKWNIIVTEVVLNYLRWQQYRTWSANSNKLTYSLSWDNCVLGLACNLMYNGKEKFTLL